MSESGSKCQRCQCSDPKRVLRVEVLNPLSSGEPLTSVDVPLCFECLDVVHKGIFGHKEQKQREQPAPETSIRDQFAMAALTGIMSSLDRLNLLKGGYREVNIHEACVDAYALADGMLKARKAVKR